MNPVWKTSIGFALGLLAFFVVGEYTSVTRFATHSTVFDSEAAAMQKAVNNLHTTTRLALFATWLQCPVSERSTIIIANLPSAPEGVEIQKSRLFERFFVQRQARVTPSAYAQCTRIDAEEIMKGAAA